MLIADLHWSCLLAPASSTFLSQQISISQQSTDHQPIEQSFQIMTLQDISFLKRSKHQAQIL
jgi:hypothetical protein